MKTKLIIMLVLFSILLTASTDKKPKQFKVTLTVTYNSITLAKAAELEKIFRDRFSDACNVDIKLEETTGIIFYSGITRIDTVQWRNIYRDDHLNPDTPKIHIMQSPFKSPTR